MSPTPSHVHVYPPESVRAALARARRPGEQGAVLIVSLLLLVVLTLLGIEAMRVANFDMALATNAQARARALAEAESAVVDAEDFIGTNFTAAPVYDWSADDGLYDVGALTESAVTAVNWADSGGNYETGSAGGQYTIEYLGFSPPSGSSMVGTVDRSYLYRITARGTAASGSVRFVQTIFEVAN